MKHYHYFISCSFSDGYIGMVEYLSSHKIESFDDIIKARNSIARESNRPSFDVSILNYQLIQDEPY